MKLKKVIKNIKRKVMRSYRKAIIESTIKSENKDLKIENDELRDAIDKLNAEIQKLELDKDVAYVNDLKKSLIERTRQRDDLREENDELMAEVKQLKAEVKTLKENVKILENQE